MLSSETSIRQNTQDLRVMRCRELVTDKLMNDVSNVSFTDPPDVVVDTLLNNVLNDSFDDTRNHSPPEDE